MKVTIKLPKRRNPLAVLARQREGGSHQHGGPSRQALQQELRRRLAQEA